MDIDLSSLSQNELNDLIEKSQQEIVKRKNNILTKRRIQAANNLKSLSKDILDKITHDRTSCSDENPCNGYSDYRGYAKCQKCHLLNLMSDAESLDEVDYEVFFSVELNKIE